MAVMIAEQLTLPRGHLSKPCALCSGWGELEATDMFSGAGGSSLGLEAVCCPQCGRQLIRVTQALNHWDLAVEAHNANFPDADHDLHDVEVIPAARFRRTPLLWASPECTHHAYCRGPRNYDPDAMLVTLATSPEYEASVANTGRGADARAEAIQVAAMAVRYVIDLCDPVPA